MFGLCHLGVIKALHLRGLLPRIITGTGTGALIAALVGTHTEDDLLDFLNGDGIDLAAFAVNNANYGSSEKGGIPGNSILVSSSVLLQRLAHLIRTGHLLDTGSLVECVRLNVGDLTFEEAYARTKRVLNITIPTSGRGGVPNLLNYLTAPNVLIRSAAEASSTSFSAVSQYQPMSLLCKDETGAIACWSHSSTPGHSLTPATRHLHTQTLSERDSPLSRIAELFNVNHFIVSQARPYIAPFLRSDLQHPRSPRQARRTVGFSFPLLKMVTSELHHRLNQLDALSLLPFAIRRLLIDETIPGASITLVPDLNARDLLRLLEHPTKESLEHWSLQGERAVWPNVCSLRIRCAVEVELDRCYQLVRRRKPLDAVGAGGLEIVRKRRDSAGSGGSKRRKRASSLGQG